MVKLINLSFLAKIMEEYILYEVYSQICESPGSEEVGFVPDGLAGGGHFGIAGAGILIFCPGLNEILLVKRTVKEDVDSPGLWSVPGGSRKIKEEGLLEEALVTAVDETRDELGSLPNGRIRKKPYFYEKPGSDFTYQTFILEIEQEERNSFKPKLDWENDDCRWFKRDSLDGIELHPGLRDLLGEYLF
ncbi:hypothetical protein A3K73_01240 [Candidatus Pacearchaeota archaeon RBG_13_36_9]|nr:MAG: hypothetical protein A3K73_01240 [Candidatus Pacearchaeota archaeon RBG_13_36_9]